jgi:hypothetical protein
LVHPFTDDVTGGGRRAGKPPQQRDPRDVTMRSTPPTTGPGWPRVQDTTWPLQSHLELGALPTAVPCARLHSRLVAGEWAAHSRAGLGRQPADTRAADAGPDAESGRGLLLVDSLSAQWGSQRSQDGNGKVVWAVIHADPPP